MRFSTDIIFNGKGPYGIPTNYRIPITSLLKEAVKKIEPDLYTEYWGNPKSNIPKPFTFSVSIPNPKTIKEKDKNYFEFSDNYLRLYFSSSETTLVMRMYNALLNISGEYFLFNNGIVLKHFNLKKDTVFNSITQKFKIISPVIVRKIKNKKGIGELTFEDENFEDTLFHETSNLCKNFIDNDYSLKRDEFKIETYKCRTVNIYHYNSVIKGTSGNVEVTAPMEVLRLIYYAGFGARRSQGFGRLEVLR